VVWLAGEAPRAIALIPSTTTRSLGVPGKDGVPVLLGPQDWAALRVIPIPGVDKKTKVVPKAEIVDLAGWKQSAFVRSQLQGLAACGKKPPAHRFMLTRWSGTASVDGNIENASNMIYDVRTDGTQTCVAGQSMLLSPKSGSSVPSPVAGAKAKTATPGPAAWLRGDLLANKFDAGNRGLPAVTEVRKMKCQLGNKP
jgi:hypothetical protein